jgi:PadR family transcriptional regulator PadR
MAAMGIQEPTFFILTALVEQPLHGYGVMQAIKTLSAGRVNLRPSTLYAALDRLAADGRVEVEREEAVDGRLRRYYRLTDDGARVLAAEVQRMQESAATAEARLRCRRSAGSPRLATMGLQLAFVASR